MRRYLEYPAFISLILLLTISGFLTGLYGVSFQIDLFYVVLDIFILDAVLSSIIFAILSFSLALIFLMRDFFNGEIEIDDSSDLPAFTAIIPVYNEHHVLEKSVRSLRDLDYDLKIIVACEQDDKQTISKAREMSEDLDNVSFTVNTSQPGSKAGAINDAVKQIENKVFGVFDVDEEINPGFVTRALAWIRDGQEVVQGRAVPEPEGFFESLVFFEQYLAHLNFQLVYLLTGYRLAGSRTTIMKKSVWEKTGGYNDQVLTEDYHFSFKCYRKHIDVAPMMSYPSKIEAAHNLRDWWNQRKRWMAGYLQVFFSLFLSMNPRRYRDVISVLISFGSIVGSMMMVFLASKFLLLLFLNADIFFLIPISTVVILAAVLGLNDSRNHEIEPNYLSTALTPIMFSIYGLVALKAFIETIFRKEVSWYSVSKKLK